MNDNKAYKQIRIIFYAILSGLLFFGLGAFGLVKMQGIVNALTPMQMQYIETIIIIMAFIGIPTSHYFHKKKTESINPALSPEEKLSRYRVSFFIKMATFEGLSLISLLTYLMSGNNTFLIIYSILLITILINYPGKSKVAEELNMETDELFSTTN